MGSTLEPLRHTNTILLTTYKRDGTPVGTPVSIAFNDSRASFRSWHKAWKTKRLANNPQVEAAPSTLRGEPTGPAIRHEVVGMTRSASKREAVADLGAAPVVADALDGENVTRAVADAPAGPVHPAVRCARGAVRPPRGDEESPRELRSRPKERAYVCVCDCGVEKVVDRGPLRDGRVRSCRCLQHEHQLERARLNREAARPPGACATCGAEVGPPSTWCKTCASRRNLRDWLGRGRRAGVSRSEPTTG